MILEVLATSAPCMDWRVLFCGWITGGDADILNDGGFTKDLPMS